jgi:imidazolonepropionase-like amidohydrolase
VKRIAWIALAAGTLMAGQNDTFLLRNATVYPVSGPKMENATILVVDGKIAEVGVKVTPPKGKVRIVEGKGLMVYPGMIDSGSPIGLSEVSSVRETNDVGELGDFNPQLRSIIAVNPESEHIPVVRANGITSVMVLPGGGSGLISGQVSLMHLNGWTWEEMEIRRGAAMQMRWPTYSAGGGRGGGGGGARGGAAGAMAEARKVHDQQVKSIQEFFEQARAYQGAKAANTAGFKTDLKLEAMIPVLEGKLPVMIAASREREIKEAVEWATKEKLKIVLANVRRAGKMTEELAKRKIPVILGSTFTTPLEDADPYDEPFTLPGELHKAGVKIAFASFGVQFARNLPYQASQAVPFGLPYDEALKSVTLNAAEIWGVADQYGSIEKGKWADLIVTDGDPLEVKTNVRMMFVKGEAVDLESKHTRLYKKYSARP